MMVSHLRVNEYVSTLSILLMVVLTQREPLSSSWFKSMSVKKVMVIYSMMLRMKIVMTT